MRKYNGVHYDLDIRSQTVKLRPEYHNQLLSNETGSFNGFKKFGGSSIGNIFETDAFKGKFLAFLHMARLAMPVFKQKYVIAGEAVEPKIFDALRKQTKIEDIQHIVAKDVGYDYFKNKHPIVGGVPDGLIPSKKIVLEMKSVQSKKRDLWIKDNGMNLPLDYRKQAELYAYLLGYDKYVIVAAFLEENDYFDPQNINIFERHIESFAFSVDPNRSKDDLQKIIDFYNHYSRTGISPIYDARRDAMVVEYLACHNEEEWFNLFTKWKALGEIDEDIEFSKVR
ncbi:hypothetical protein MBVG596_0397 [Mycoplasmopsis bovigenitalium]|uniref:MAGa7180 family putative nuclease n=1 Tax=Mycoplasmopsis bovigenitalium TaxID=2112 RepID=UPI000909F6AA|nr:hypothetical protein [Mycoplasmopsis bovigenitalium]BAW18197.1 hypothetical protein MBVG596_0397 [Mycoplasmopsis bovigenitalium]